MEEQKYIIDELVKRTENFELDWWAGYFNGNIIYEIKIARKKTFTLYIDGLVFNGETICTKIELLNKLSDAIKQNRKVRFEKKMIENCKQTIEDVPFLKENWKGG